MLSELGHRIVWYIHGYECCGGAFWDCHTGHQKMEAVGPGQIVCADHLDCTVHKCEDHNFES